MTTKDMRHSEAIVVPVKVEQVPARINLVDLLSRIEALAEKHGHLPTFATAKERLAKIRRLTSELREELHQMRPPTPQDPSDA